MGGRQARGLTLALTVLAASIAVAATQPSSALLAVAANVKDRVVQIKVSPSNMTGLGFAVGEHTDASGRPVLVVVTADHVIGQRDQPMSLEATYCADRAHTWAGTLRNERIPAGPGGDLAVLEVPVPPGR